MLWVPRAHCVLCSGEYAWRYVCDRIQWLHDVMCLDCLSRCFAAAAHCVGPRLVSAVSWRCDGRFGFTARSGDPHALLLVALCAWIIRVVAPSLLLIDMVLAVCQLGARWAPPVSLLAAVMLAPHC